KYGCESKLTQFRTFFSNDIIEKNYAMLTDEQKRAILATEEFSEREAILAVAVLKRRMDFFDKNEQRYDAEYVSIETAKAGRGVLIRWEIKPDALGRYELVGYRNTGGFSPNQWDESNNGALVVHTQKSGETIELLNEDTAYFYTFFLRGGPDGKGQVPKFSP